MICLDELIEAAYQLEPLPASALRLAALVAEDDASLDEIVDVIAYDQALTARLLRMANSALSANQVTISTVKDAVVRLGRSRVLSLAVALGCRPRMQRALPEYGLTEGQFWRHSVSAALTAEETSAFCTISIPPAAATAALLHDVGKLVLSRFLNPEVLGYLQRATREGGMSSLLAEREILQVHHGELGGLIAQRWQLPECIVKGITYHHDPEAGQETICDVVHLADVVTTFIGAELGDELVDPIAQEQTRDRLGISLAGFENLCDTAAHLLKEVTERYQG